MATRKSSRRGILDFGWVNWWAGLGVDKTSSGRSRPRRNLRGQHWQRTGLALQPLEERQMLSINEPPVVQAPGPQNITRAGSAAPLAPLFFAAASDNLISVTDADAGSEDVEVSLEATHGLLTLSQTTGLAFTTGDGLDDAALVFTGSLSEVNAAMDGLKFDADQSFSGVGTLIVSVDDLGNTGDDGPKHASRLVNIGIDHTNVRPTVYVPPRPIATLADTPHAVTGVSISDPDVGGADFSLNVWSRHGQVAIKTDVPWGVTADQVANNGASSVSILAPLAAINATLADAAGVVYQSPTGYSGRDLVWFNSSDQGNTGTIQDGTYDNQYAEMLVVDHAVISGPAHQYVWRNATELFSAQTGNQILVMDPAGGFPELRISLGVGHGTLQLGATEPPTFLSGGNGQSHVEFAGNLAEVNAWLNTLSYTPSTDYLGPDGLIINLFDDQNDALDQRTINLGIGLPNLRPEVAAPTELLGFRTTGGPLPPIALSDGDAAQAIVRFWVFSQHGALDIDTNVAGGIQEQQLDFYGGNGFAATATLAQLNATLAAGGIEYLPDANYQGADSISLGLDDLGNTGSGGPLWGGTQLRLYVVDGLAVSVPSPQTASDTDLVFSTEFGNLIEVVDTENSSAQISLTVSTEHGRLSVQNLGSGATLSGQNTAEVTLVGTQAQLTAALDGLVYHPTRNYSGSAPLSIEAHEVATPSIDWSGQVAIQVRHLNQPPNIRLAADLFVTAPGTPLSLAGITMQDTDVGNGEVGINLVVQHGALSIRTDVAGGVASTQVEGNSSGLLRLRAPLSEINATLAAPGGLVYAPVGSATTATSDDYRGGDLLMMQIIDLQYGEGITERQRFRLARIEVTDRPTNIVPLGQHTPLNQDLSFSEAGGNRVRVVEPNEPVLPNNAAHKLTVALSVTHGTLSTGAISDISQITTLNGATSGQDHFTFQATLPFINEVLEGLRFFPDRGFSGVAELTITTTDPNHPLGPQTVSDTVTIGVDHVNEPPSIRIADRRLPFEVDAPRPLTGISLSDPDAGQSQLIVRLFTGWGTLDVSTSVPGGLREGQVFDGLGGNLVMLIGSPGEIQQTLAAPQGVMFTPLEGFDEFAWVLIDAHDQGASGQGGQNYTVQFLGLEGPASNHSPDLVAPGRIEIEENEGVDFSLGPAGDRRISVSDADLPEGVIVAALFAEKGSVSVDAVTGPGLEVWSDDSGEEVAAIILEGELELVNAALATARFDAQPGYVGQANVRVVTSDLASPSPFDDGFFNVTTKVVPITIHEVTTPQELIFSRVGTPGGLVLQVPDRLETILDPERPHTFFFDAQALERLTVTVTPSGKQPTLAPQLQLIGPDGHTLAFAFGGVGQPATLDRIQLPATGRYTVSLHGDQDSVGGFVLSAIRNASVSALHADSPESTPLAPSIITFGGPTARYAGVGDAQALRKLGSWNASNGTLISSWGVVTTFEDSQVEIPGDPLGRHRTRVYTDQQGTGLQEGDHVVIRGIFGLTSLETYEGEYTIYNAQAGHFDIDAPYVATAIFDMATWQYVPRVAANEFGAVQAMTVMVGSVEHKLALVSRPTVDGGLDVIDITNAQSPQFLANYRHAGPARAVESIEQVPSEGDSLFPDFTRITTTEPHGLRAGQTVRINGAGRYAGEFRIVHVTPNSFDIPVLYDQSPQGQYTWQDLSGNTILPIVGVGSRVYLGSQDGGGVYVVDLADPAIPVEVGRIHPSVNGSQQAFTNVFSIATDGDYLYVASNDDPVLNATSQVLVYDAQNLQFVRAIDTQATSALSGLHVEDDRLYASALAGLVDQNNPAEGWTGFTDIFDIGDIGDTALPVSTLAHLDTGLFSFMAVPTPDGNHLVVTRLTLINDAPTDSAQVTIWDISDLENPTVVQSFNAADFGLHALGAGIPMVVQDPADNTVRLFVSWFQAGILAFDITNPADPQYITGWGDLPEDLEAAFLSGMFGVGLQEDGIFLTTDLEHGLYVLDGSPDEQSFTLDLKNYAGEKLDITVRNIDGRNFGHADVTLYDPTGTVVSTANTGVQPPIANGETAENFDLSILGFQVAAPTGGSGTYTLKVRSARDGRYNVLVTKELAVVPKIGEHPVRLLDTFSGGIGHLPLGGADYYHLTLTEGQSVRLSTQTPLDQIPATTAGSARNRLDPMLAVWAPGTDLDEDSPFTLNSSGAADQKNAALSFTAAVSGVYVVSVAAEDDAHDEPSAGDYVLLVERDGQGVITTSGIPDVYERVPTQSTVIDLYPRFEDALELDHQLTYTVRYVNPAGVPLVESAAIANGQLTIVYANLWTGVAEFVVRAANSRGQFVEAPFRAHMSADFTAYIVPQPIGAVNQTMLFEIGIPFEQAASQPIPPNQNEAYSYTIHWGDGSQTTLKHSVLPFTYEHAYAQPGVYEVTVQATNFYGQQSNVGREDLRIVSGQAILAGRMRDFSVVGHTETVDESRPSYVKHTDFEFDPVSPVQKDLVKIALAPPDNAHANKPLFDSADGNPRQAGGIESAVSFSQWYTDYAGVNAPQSYSLVLAESSLGVYEFSAPHFFPLDDRLEGQQPFDIDSQTGEAVPFGNEGNPFNHHFTLEAHGTFTFNTNQWFTFGSDDDLWIFIDGQRVVDNGGVHPNQYQTVDLAKLGIGDGEHTFDLFYADRHTNRAELHLTTNILFNAVCGDPVIASIAGPSGGQRGQDLEFTLLASHPGVVNPAERFTFGIDWDGNGTQDETVIGPSGTRVTHEWLIGGTFDIGLIATDACNVASPLAQHTVTITSPQMYLQGRLRDFSPTTTAEHEAHADFERDLTGFDIFVPTTGLVDDELPALAPLDPLFVAAEGAGGIADADSFAQWFADVPGVNTGMDYTLVFQEREVGSGQYYSHNVGFFPLDGKLFGNEGNNHNYHFTYEASAQFVHKDDLTLTVESDDDLWVFINGQLVEDLDLGGLHRPLERSVDLDGLAASFGLVAGQTYDIAFYFAERHSPNSVLNIDTNIVFVEPDITTGPCDDPDHQWRTIESGGSDGGRGGAEAGDGALVIREGDSFLVGVEQDFTVPDRASVLSFEFLDLTFDVSDQTNDDADQDDLNDAFEIALVDQDGRTLVETFAADKNSFYNATQGQAPKGGDGIEVVEIAGAPGRYRVQIGLSHLAPGTQATLQVRLVNNDEDELTQVSLPCDELPEIAAVKFFTVDAGGQTFQYTGDDPLSDHDYQLVRMPRLASGNSQPRDIASVLGDTYWVLDASSQVFVYNPDGTLRGSWQDAALTDPQGIAASASATPGAVDLWIVDADALEVRQYEAAGALLSGTATHDLAWDLDEDNDAPTTLTVRGGTVWVAQAVAGAADEVFVYDAVDGELLGRWTLDAANGDAQGLALDPTGGDTLWVLDRADKLVYQYDAGLLNTTGSDAADENFALHSENADPVGIADPPALSLFSPADRNLPAGTTVLLSGQAVTDDGRKPVVTINNQAAQVVDAAGRFFQRITADPGRQTLNVSALDTTGAASAQAALVGYQVSEPQVDTNLLSIVSASFRPVYGRTSFNTQTDILYADVAIQNTGAYDLDVPLLVGVTGLSQATVSVNRPDGWTADGIPYYDFSRLVDDGRLSAGANGTAGEQSRFGRLVFYNPDGVQFDYRLVILGTTNHDPEFTSLPVVEIPAGVEYSYLVTAWDADPLDRGAVNAAGQIVGGLAISLVSGPQTGYYSPDAGVYAMNVQPSDAPDSALLKWRPGDADVGNHEVLMQVRDSHGGVGYQRFTLRVTKDLPNRPPKFDTDPVTVAYVNTPYIYDVDASDPDAWVDPLTSAIGFEPVTIRAVATPAELLGPGEIVLDFEGNDREFFVDANGGGATDLDIVHWDRPKAEYVNKLVWITLEATDTHGATAVQSYRILVLREPGNRPPIFVTEPQLVWRLPDAISTATPGVSPTGPILLDAIDNPATTGVREDILNLSVSLDVNTLAYPSDGFRYGDIAMQVGRGSVDWYKLQSQVAVLYKHLDTGQHLVGNGGLLPPEFEAGNFVSDGVFDSLGNLYAVMPKFHAVIRFNNRGELAPGLLRDSAGRIIPGSFLGVPDLNNHIPSPSDPDWQFTFPESIVIDAKGNIYVGDAGDSSQVGGEGNVPNPIARSGGGIRKFSPDGQFLELILKDVRVDGLALSPDGKTLYWVDESRYIKTLDLTRPKAEERQAVSTLNASALPNSTSTRVWASEGVRVFSDGRVLATCNADIRMYAPNGVLLAVFNATPASQDYFGLAGAAIEPDETGFWATDPGSGFAYHFQVPVIPPTATLPLIVSDDINRRLDTGAQLVEFPFFLWWFQFFPLGRVAIYGDPFSRITDVDVVLSDDGGDSVSLVDHSGTQAIPLAGGTATFDVTLSGQGLPGASNLLFIKSGTNLVVGRIPIVVKGGYQYASKAVDPDGDQVTYSLDLAPVQSKPAKIDPRTGLVSWKPPLLPSDDGYLPDQKYQFRIKAEDGRGGVAFQDFTVDVSHVVNSPNIAPEFQTIPPSQAREGEAFTYRMVATDADRDQVEYLLSEGPAGMKVDRGTGELTWTPTTAQSALVNGNYQSFSVVVQVSDGRGGIVDQQFDVQVLPRTLYPNNHPPAFTEDNVDLGGVTPGGTVRYQAIANDSDGDQLEFGMAFFGVSPVPEGFAIDKKTGEMAWTPGPTQTGSYSVLVAVTDGRGGVDHMSIAFHTNYAPRILSDIVGGVQPGGSYWLTLKASDYDGDALTWSVVDEPPGLHLTLHPTTDPFEIDLEIDAETTIAVDTDVSFSLAVTDGKNGYDSHTYTLHVYPPPSTAVNQPPQFLTTALPDSRAVLGQPYGFDFDAEDFDPGDSLTFSFVTPVGERPAGMILNSETGVLTWTPEPADHTGEYPYDLPLTVRVSDPQGAYQDWPLSLHVMDRLENKQIFIRSKPAYSVVYNQTYQYDLRSEDADGDAPQWRLDKAPLGMTLDTRTGAVRWTPTIHQLGVHEVQASVLDGHGAGASQTWNVTVYAVNLPPRIDSIPDSVVIPGRTYTYAPHATDPDGNTLKWTLETPLSGVSVDLTTGVLTWINPQLQLAAPDPNHVTFRIRAEDFLPNGQPAGAKAWQEFTVEIVDPLSNLTDTPPKITSTPPLVAELGIPYQYLVVAEDPDLAAGDELQFLLEPGGPSELSIVEQPDGKSALISGVFTQQSLQTYSVRVVDSAGAMAGQKISVSVRGNAQPQVLNLNGTAQAVPEQAFAFDVRTLDADGDKLTFSLDGAAVAAGLAIDRFGRVTWTPAEDADELSPLAVAVTVTDGIATPVTRTLTISIAADETDPTVVLQPIKSPAPKNQPIPVSVQANDNVGVASVELRFGPAGLPWEELQAVPLAANGQATITTSYFQTPGDYQVVARARDAAGGTTTTPPQLVSIYDPAMRRLPQLTLTDPTAINPTTGQRNPVKDVTTVSGKVVDLDGQSDIASQSLVLQPMEGGSAVPLSMSALEADGDFTATIDPTALANGVYLLVLTATDATTGEQVSTSIDVTIGGQLKLGNFRMSFTDLQLPLAGLPIVIGRTYDSFNGNTSRDFGHGWQLDLFDIELTSTVPSSNLEQYGQYTGIADGDRVYVRLPDGRREGFTFKAVSSGLFSATPSFVPDPGVTDRLTVPPVAIQTREGMEGYFVLAGQPYNPADPLWGGYYTLTTKEGFQFDIDAHTGKLISAENRAGHRLLFEADGIKNEATGEKITIHRDYRDRIAEIVDLEGKSIKYGYSPQGDLVSVTDRANSTVAYSYGGPAAAGLSHQLTAILDPLGNPTLQIDYNSASGAGRMAKLTDAKGNAVTLNYNVAQRSQTVHSPAFTGPNGDLVVTSTTTTLNADGNPTRIERTNFNANYNSIADQFTEVTLNEYTDPQNPNRPTRVAQVLGVADDAPDRPPGDPADLVVQYKYDSSGNRYESIDAFGNVSRTGFNAFGQPTLQIDPTGVTAKLAYDLSGNVTRRETQTSVTGANPLVTTYFYDTLGRPTGSRSPANNATATPGPAAKIEYAGSFPGLPTTPAGHEWVKQTDEAGVVSFSETDKNKRVVRTIRPGVTAGTTIEINTIYDGEGRVLSTTGPTGASTNAYDSRGLRISSTDVAGRVTKYRYDDRGVLTNTIYPDDTPATDADNPATEQLYDDLGRVVGSKDARGNQTTYRLDGAGRQIVVIAPDLTDSDVDNLVTKTVYDAAGRVTAQVEVRVVQTAPTFVVQENRTEFTFDALGRVVQTHAPDGTITRTVYDAAGRVTYQTDRYVDAGANTVWPHGTHTMYDEAGRAKMTQRVSALKIAFVTDSGGRLRSELDTHGPVLSQTSTSYDAGGRVKSSTNADGLTTAYHYDAVGRQVMVAASDSVTKYFYDPATGRLDHVQNPLGHKVQYKYDAAGRQTRTVYDLNDNKTFDDANEASTLSPTGDRYEEVSYNDLGQKTAERDQGGRVTTYAYDTFGNLSDVYLPAVDDPSTSADDETGTHPHYHYEYNALGDLLFIRDPLGRQTHFGYDKLGRRDLKLQPFIPAAPLSAAQLVDHAYLKTLSPYETWTYDDLGREKSHTDYKGQTMTNTYDSLGRLDYVEYAAGAQTPAQVAQYEKTDYSYNALGQLTSITEYAGASSDNPPLARLTTYGYDLDGRQTLVDSPEGILHYEYDAATGRQTRVWSEDLSTTVDNPATTTINELFDATTDVRYSYDLFGRLQTVREYVRAGGEQTTPAVTGYAYDAAGNLTGVSLPNGNSPRVTTYKYDALERLSEILNQTPATTGNFSSPAVTHFQQNYTRNAAGQIARIEETTSDYLRPTNVIDYVYDQLGRLTEEHYESSRTVSTTAPGKFFETRYDDSYVYDLVGNRLSKSHHAQAAVRVGNVTTLYDDVLEEIDYDYSVSDAMAANLYDRLRIETVDRTTSTLPRNDNGPTGAPAMSASSTVATHYAYDANGAQVKKGPPQVQNAQQQWVDDPATEYYRFDLRGRLAQVSLLVQPAGFPAPQRATIDYRYDHQSFRVGMREDDGAQGFIRPYKLAAYLPDHRNPTGYAQTLEAREVNSFTGASNSVPQTILRTEPAGKSFVWGHGLVTQNGQYFIADHHGSTRQVGIETFEFDAFGVPTDLWAPNVNGVPIAKTHSGTYTHLYTGEQFDAGIGLQFNRARWLNLTTASFVSADPFDGSLAHPLTLPKYWYAAADGVNKSDPSGEFFVAEVLLSSILSAAIAAGTTAAYGYAKGWSGQEIGRAATTSALFGFGFGALGAVAFAGAGLVGASGAAAGTLAGQQAGQTAMAIIVSGVTVPLSVQSFWRALEEGDEVDQAFAGVNLVIGGVGYGLARFGAYNVLGKSTAVSRAAYAKQTFAAPGDKPIYRGDIWEDTLIEQNSLLLGSIPAETASNTPNFFAFADALSGTSRRSDMFWRRLQVAPHKTLGFRRHIGVYRVKRPTEAASAVVRANPDLGPGGERQVFISDPTDAVELIMELDLW